MEESREVNKVSEKIEQFWRDATPDDVARVMRGEKVEARFRDTTGSTWRHGLLVGWSKIDESDSLKWASSDCAFWRFCQVYDPTETKPTQCVGRVCSLATSTGVFCPHDSCDLETGVRETNNPEIPDSSTAANTLEISNSRESAPVVKEYLKTEPRFEVGDYLEPVKAEVLTQAKMLHRVLYLAGPMRGIAFYNFPMFDRVAAALRDAGYEVINPADEDRKEDNFDPTLEPKFADPAYCFVQPGMDFGKIIRRCFEAVMRCDEIVLLPGWENSVGAIAELFIAVWSGKRIQLVYFEENDQMQFISTPAIDLATAITRLQHARNETKQSEKSDDEDVLDIAARITRGDRQAVYGPPEQDFKKTADMWTGLFQYMLAEEAKFEPRHVAMALICMKMSREFHQRKKDNWVDIAGYARCGSLCE